MSPYEEPGDEIRHLAIVRSPQEHLAGILGFGVPPLRRGQAIVTTITQEGWSLRVYVPCNQYKSVSLMWDPRIGSGIVRMPSCDHLRDYMPEAGHEIGQLRQEVSRMGFDMESIRGRRSVGIPEQDLIREMPRLAPVIRALATLEFPS